MKRVHTVGLLCGLMLAGCDNAKPRPADKASEPAKSAQPTSEAKVKPGPTDDSQAVSALELLDATLKRDAEGFVAEVKLSGDKIDDAAVAPLASLKHLRTAVLAETQITDKGLATLAKIPTLQNLDLRICKLTNAGLTELSSLTNLRTLRLSGKNNKTTVDDKGVVSLGKLTKLKVLGLDVLWVGEDGLAALAELKDLEELYLAETLVDDRALVKLASFPKLKKLRLAKTQITNDGLAEVAKLMQLEDLDISECSQLQDAGFAHLTGMKQLTRLNLYRVQIGDAGLAHLAGLTNMQWLNVDNTRLTDAGLESFKGMTQLTFLHAGSTAISDAGLKSLEPLTALKKLVVTRTSVTAAGVAQLQKTLSHTEIQLKRDDDQ